MRPDCWGQLWSHYSLSPCLRFILVHMLVCPPKIRPTKVTHLDRKSSLAYMACEFPRPGRYISFLRKKLTSLGLGSSIISNVHQTSQWSISQHKFLGEEGHHVNTAADRYDDKCTQRVDKVQSVQAQGLQTLPQAKRHQPLLLITFFGNFNLITFITWWPSSFD